MTAPPLPWQRTQWQRVAAMQAAGRLPHALLLRGPEDVGKRTFADRLCGALLCEAPADGLAACGRCRSCRLVAAGSHPDQLILEPPEGKRAIGIDRVRELIERVGLTASHAARKAVLVSPAEDLTHQAANTLLKTLEEPPGDCVFVLVADRPGALPATIRSRCQMIDFPLPPPDTALAWLAEPVAPGASVAAALRLAHGAPLRAAQLLDEGGLAARDSVLEGLGELAACASSDPVAVAEGWRALGATAAIYWLASLLGDVIRLKNGGPAHNLTHSDRDDAMQALARALDLNATFRLLDAVIEARRALTAHPSLNEQLVLESIAVEWAVERQADARG